MTMVIDLGTQGYVIRVDGYPKMTYIGYGLQEAIKRYRAQYGLTYKHLRTIRLWNRER